MEADQIDVFAFAVLGDFQQIDEAQETRFARQLRSDVRKADRLDGIDFDLAFFHAVAVADLDVGARPDADAARDFAAADSLAKALGEHHEKSLHPSGDILYKDKGVPNGSTSGAAVSVVLGYWPSFKRRGKRRRRRHGRSLR